MAKKKKNRGGGQGGGHGGGERDKPKEGSSKEGSSKEGSSKESPSKKPETKKTSAVLKAPIPKLHGPPPKASNYPKDSKPSSSKPAPEKQRSADVVSGGSVKHVDITKPMSRPGHGTAGKKTVIITNFFKMAVSDSLVAHQYSICIWRKKRPTKHKNKNERSSSKTPPSGLGDYEDVASSGLIQFNRAVFNQVTHKYRSNIKRNLAYDGRSIAYSAGEVSRSVLAEKLEAEVGRDGEPTEAEKKQKRTEKVYLTIEHAKSLKYADVIRGHTSTINSTEYLACLDVALAASPMGNYVQVGRSFYTDSHSVPLGHPNRGPHTASAWRGFYQSARLSEMGLVVNLDESCTAFWNNGGQSLINLVRVANGNRDLAANTDSRFLRSVSTALRGVKVRAQHTGITYKVHGFVNKSADSFSFTTQEGKKTTISQYFSKQYNYRLKHGNLACVKVHPKRDTLIPIEVLTVVPKQRVTGLLSAEQTQSIVRIASSRPDARRKAAENTMKRLNHNSDPVCREFSVKVDTNLIKANARILPVPKIQYKDDQVFPSQGQWRTKATMVDPKDLSSWAVINTARLQHRNQLKEFIVDLVRAANKAGMNVPMRQPYMSEVQPDHIVHEMRKMTSDHARDRDKKGLQLIVIIRERKDAPFYNMVKRTADLELGVASQVLQASFVQNKKGRDMYCDNVILKVNAKLGGVNSYVREFGSRDCPNVSFLTVPHIILGADVTHPVGGSSSPSVAALCGSRDKQATQFSASIRCQPGKQEVIKQLGEMFREVYHRWLQNFGGNYRVASIIMFRDGVSEGQFEEVMQVEVAALRRAYMEAHPEIKDKVKITYIIVTKRHHTRFFPERKEDGDRSGNVRPGTVVDRGITSNEYYDFYLNSHAGIQGTSKPSKYTVLIDENNVGVDALQGYVFRLAHAFVRCNRSVSMVHSAYYAHLLAFRGRAYLGEDGSDAGSVASGSGKMPSFKIHSHLQPKLYWV